jgi:hypothetical protein
MLEIFAADPWLVAVGEMALVPLISIVCISVCVCTRKIRLARFDFELKRDMLDRGMSADDIRTVIEAGRQIPPRVASRPPLTDPSVESTDARNRAHARVV